MTDPKPKRRVYMGEFNLLMNGTTYLPLVSGLLRVNAEQSAVVREHFEFAPFLFHTDSVDKIVAAYQEPAVAAFSMLMWNAELSLKVAAKIKRRFPDCLIVVGGANVPHYPEEFLAEHPFIDIAARGEGEDCFTALLERFAEQPDLAKADFRGIANTSWQDRDGGFHHCSEELPFQRDLDTYPSPYLAGVFDDILATRHDLQFQAIIETNRGCPFQCTFCYWGKGGMSRKYRFHGIERVKAEIEWMADNELRYVFNADSNFGMHRRDWEIAELLVETKARTGFPEKFRTCYGKNTDEKIFKIGKLFHDHQLEKGITISYQSVDAQVQKNIKRDNIKLESARELQRKFNDSGVPVYTELILGLPGESLRSWVDGVDRILASGLRNQLFMYICQIFPNTDLADPDYRTRFGIESKVIDLKEIHGSLRTDDWVKELEEIVIASDTMDTADWRRALVFSWVTMTMHSLKLGAFVLAWLVDRFEIKHSDFLLHLAEGNFDTATHPIMAAELNAFHRKIDQLLDGVGRGCAMPEYGEIYWDEEEASFLRLSRDFTAFYQEFEDLVVGFLSQRGLRLDLGQREQLAEVIRYQSLSIPRPDGPPNKTESFEHNLHGYFEALFSSTPIPIKQAAETVLAEQPDFAGALPRFARESILWGRKSGTMLARLRRAGDYRIPQPQLDPTCATRPNPALPS